MIEIKGAVKKFGRLKALNGVDVTFDNGKITALLGLNGVGKSTILKSIMGLVKLDKGEILIDGEKLSYKTHDYMVFIPDVESDYGYMTIKESFEFMNDFYENWNMDKAKEMLKSFKIDENKKISTLSKGNIAKVKLVLGFAREPKYLLLDEPFSGIDLFTRESFLSSMLRNMNDNMTIILTTHEVKEIENIADDVVLLNEGKVVSKFNAQDVKELEGLSIVDKMKEVYRDEISC